MRTFFRQPVDDVLAALEPIVTVRSPIQALAPFVIAMIVTWFVYVPIHELLHVLGCMLGGGEVSRLEISPRYGGTLLARVFPFVVPGGDYAGRLSGFDWKDSDLIYLLTDFMPYVLTVVIGVPLIKVAGRRRRPIVFAMGVVVGLTPFYQLPGDYYEMGSILTTRAVAQLGGSSPTEAPAADATEPQADSPAAEAASAAQPPVLRLRSDDVFKLITDVFRAPEELGIEGVGGTVLALLIILVGMTVAVLLAFATYWAGHLVSRPLGAPARAAGPRTGYRA